jgi:hypothetical protein
MILRSKLSLVLVPLLILDAASGLAQTKRRSTTQRSTTARKAVATPKATPESRIPVTARRLKPSGAIAAFMVTGVQAGAAPGTGSRRSTTTANDPEKFKALLERAVVYPRDVGARIVLNSKEMGIDYIEIRGNGKGFGVNTADGKNTLLVNNYKFPRIKGGVTSGTVDIEIDAEMANKATPDKKVGSRLRLTAAFIEDLKNTRVFNVPDAEEPTEKKAIKSDSEAADSPGETKKVRSDTDTDAAGTDSGKPAATDKPEAADGEKSTKRSE